MPSLLIDIPRWVKEAPKGEAHFRMAVHTILHAIASDDRLRRILCMKGGILMALHYGSPRHTTDIDFSTSATFDESSEKEVIERLVSSLAAAPAALGYEIDCRLQSHRVQPKRPDRTFVNINMSVGYAEIGTKAHGRLINGEAVNTAVSIDYSFKESIPEMEAVDIGEDETLCVYGITTLVAEKYRALLQQPIRGRNRRQDAFDLDYLLKAQPELYSDAMRQSVLDDLIVKCRDRDIEPTADSIANPEVRELSAKDYGTLADELEEGTLPSFDAVFTNVMDYYASLPWTTGLIPSA